MRISVTMNFIRPQINTRTLTIRGNTIISNNSNTSSPVLSLYKNTGTSINLGISSINYANISFSGGNLILGINGASSISISNSQINYTLPLTLSNNLNISNLSSSSQTTINLSGSLSVTSLNVSYTNPELILTAFSSQIISINTTSLSFNSTITTNGITTTGSIIGNQILGLSSVTSSTTITLTNTSNNIQILTGTSVTLTLPGSPPTGISYNIFNTGNLFSTISGTLLPAKSSAKFIYNGTNYSVQNLNNIFVQTLGSTGYLYNSFTLGNIINTDIRVLSKRIRTPRGVVSRGLGTWNTSNSISSTFAITNITGSTTITFTCSSSNFTQSMVGQTVYINTANTTPELNGYFNITSVISTTQFTITTTLTVITSLLGSVSVLPAFNWSSICWSSELNLFVMGNNGGNTTMASSVDAITWASNTVSGGIGYYNNICWSPDIQYFVGVSNNNGSTSTSNIIISPNGTSWTQLNTLTASLLNAVIWCAEYSIFVAVGGNGTNGYVATSSNGSTWTITTSTVTATTPVSATNICWSPELLIFVVTNGTGNIYYSSANPPTATSWTATTQTGSGITFSSVAWSPELYLFVAVGSSSITNVYTSPDGINWTVRATSLSAISSREIIWSQELSIFIVAGSNGIWSSSDGINWVTRNTGNDLRAIEWSPELSEFVAPINASSNILSTNPILPNTNSLVLTNPSYLNVNSNGQVNIGGTPSLNNNTRLVLSSNQTDVNNYINILRSTYSTLTIQNVGTFIFTSSTASGSANTWPQSAFDGLLGLSYWGEINPWNSTTREYTGTTFTALSNGTLYYGEWLQIQVPSPFQLASFTITGRQDQLLYLYRSPSTFIIVGSNDNVSWNLIHTANDINFGPGKQSFTVNTGNINSYTYFRICVNKVGNASISGSFSRLLSIAEWRLINPNGVDAIPNNQIGQQQLCITNATDETTSLNLMIDTNNNIGIIKSYNSRLFLNEGGGNIGIGTTNPSYLLDIQSQSTGSLPHLRVLFNISPNNTSNYLFIRFGRDIITSQGNCYLQCRMEGNRLFTNLTNTIWISSTGNVGLTTIPGTLEVLNIANALNVSNEINIIACGVTGNIGLYSDTLYIYNEQPGQVIHGLTHLNTNTGSVLTLTINGISTANGGTFITISTSSFTATMVNQAVYITGTNTAPTMNNSTFLINKVVSATRIFIANISLTAITSQSGTLIIGPSVGYYNGVGILGRSSYIFGMMTSNTDFLYGLSLQFYNYGIYIPTYQAEITGGNLITHKYSAGQNTGNFSMHYNICDTVQSGSGMGFILGKSFPTTTNSINDTSITTACRVVTNRATANYISYGFGGTVGITMNDIGNFAIGGVPNTNYSLDVNGSARMNALYINGTSPSTNLVFYVGNGTQYSQGSTTYTTWTNIGGQTISNNTTISNAMGMYSVNAWCSANLIVTSDQRIKDILQEKIDINIIDEIETISYTHKDKLKSNGNPKIGFSAQQIKKLEPNAISYTSDYIPNIYKVFELQKDKIIYNQHNLKINTKLKLILFNNEELYVEVIKIIDDNTIQINTLDIKQDKIFIYGEMVNDLHMLDYNQIYYYTIGGIQQLRKDNIILQKQIDEINSAIDDMIQSIN